MRSSRRSREILRSITVVVITLLLLVGGAGFLALHAHDGLHVDLEKLTAEIEALETPNAGLHLVRAQLFLEHEKIDEALADLDRVRAILGPEDDSDTTRIEEPFVRAKVFIASGKSEEAAALLDEVIALAGDRHPKALDVRADLHEAKGDLPAAIVDRRRAFVALATLERALALGEVLRRAGRLGEASGHYSASIAELGESRTVRDAWISVEIERGEYESALSMIDAEMRRAANRTPWLLRRAEVYAAAGNEAKRTAALAEALDEVNRVLERRPLPIHFTSRARVYLEQGDLDRAEADARTAIERAPKFLPAQQLLAEIATRRTGGAGEAKEDDGEGASAERSDPETDGPGASQAATSSPKRSDSTPGSAG